MARTLVVAAVMGTAMFVSACSSKASLADLLPSAPTTATKGRLVVSGTSVLAAGQTSQLTVVDSAGAPVTSGVQWKTLTSGVISISSAGLVMALNPGASSVQAVTADPVGTLSVYVTLPGTAPAKTLSACGAIAGGSYVLTADLLAPAENACVSVDSGVSLQIDCQGHKLPGLSLNSVGAASIGNCAITRALTLAGVSGATVSASSIAAAVTISRSTNVTVSDSSIVASAFVLVDVQRSTNVRLLRDTITNTSPSTSQSASAAVSFENGSNNQVVQCAIAGTYTGGSAYNGTDDGILDINDVGDSFQGNSITSFFDSGVEGVDLVANLTVADNTFTNVGVASISSYWCTNWTNTVLRNNDVSATPMLLYTDYSTGLGQCGAASIAGAFSNNQIVGNRFHNLAPNAIGVIKAVESPTGAAPTSGPIPRLVVAMGGVVANNLIQGNDFGGSDGPYVDPLAGFIDGGGNTCGPLNPKLSNFACTGGAPAALIRRH